SIVALVIAPTLASLHAGKIQTERANKIESMQLAAANASLAGHKSCCPPGCDKPCCADSESKKACCKDGESCDKCADKTTMACCEGSKAGGDCDATCIGACCADKAEAEVTVTEEVTVTTP